MSEEEAWARREGETEPAFEAFRVYRDMGASRNQIAVAEVLGKSQQLLSRWSAKHEWVERARAYDNHRDADNADATAAQEQELLSRLLDSAEMLRHRAHQVLANSDDISPALAVRMLEAAAKILATRRGMRADEPEHTATIDVVALATELMNRGNSNA